MTSSFKTGGPVTLSEEQIVALHQKLRDMRHDVNNSLMLIAASAELIRLRPETAADRLKLLLEQPQKVSASVAAFSGQFEGAFGLVRA